MLLKIENIKGDEQYIDDDNYIVFKYIYKRLLGFLLFHIQGKVVEKELFFNEISALQTANATKTKFLANSFQ